MSRKGKIKPEIKIQIAEDCLEGRISKSEAAKQIGVDSENKTVFTVKKQNQKL